MSTRTLTQAMAATQLERPQTQAHITLATILTAAEIILLSLFS